MHHAAPPCMFLDGDQELLLCQALKMHGPVLVKSPFSRDSNTVLTPNKLVMLQSNDKLSHGQNDALLCKLLDSNVDTFMGGPW